MTVGSLVLNIMDPFKIIRKFMLKPLAETGLVFAEEYRQRTNAGAVLTKKILLRLIIGVFLGVSVVWASIFMYAYFYYTYMPTVSHVQEVYLNYRDCQQNEKCLEYPSDTVVLTRQKHILMVGQPYRVTLYLELPESDQNDKTGMFTVCATMRNNDAPDYAMKSCRLTMIHFKSTLLKMISTVIMAPFFVLGYREEKQVISVDLFTSYEDSQTHPVTSVEVAILSNEIQFYSAQLHITANFSGLRYIMFNWPIVSGVIGILINLFFILIVCVLSWYHWDDTEWLADIKNRYEKILKRPLPMDPTGQASPAPQPLPADEDKSENIEDLSSFNENLGLTS